MKILFVSGIYPPDIGGPATYLSTISLLMTERGHEVSVLTFGERKETLPRPFAVHKVKRGGTFFLRDLRMIRAAWFLARDVDLVFATGALWDVWAVSIAVAKLRRKPIVIKVVGDSVWEMAQRLGATDDLLDRFNPARQAPFLEVLKRIRNVAAAMVDRFVTPSQYLKRIVTQWGVPQGRIDVVHNACDLPESDHPSPVKRKREMVTVARLVPWKGVGGLIRAMAEMPPDIRLVVIGDGPLMEDLKNLSQRLQLADRIEFTGRLSQEGVFARLKKSMVFVLNSSYEGFAHVILEAMAAGACILVSDAGGNTELVDHETNGIVYNVGDESALVRQALRIFEDALLRDRLTKNAARGLDRFTWPVIVHETESVFHGLIHGLS